MRGGQDVGGGVGLVSVLRLGYCRWCWTTCSCWHKAQLSGIVGGLTLCKKVSAKASVLL